MPNKAEWLQRLAFKREELLASMDGLGEAGWTTGEVSPGWAVKDVLAHIVAWETRVAKHLPDLLADQGMRLVGVEADVFNVEQVALRRERSVRELFNELADSRRRIVAALANASDEDVTKPRTVSWGQITLERWALQEIYEHDDEHAAQLRTWRAGQPESGRLLWDALADDMAAKRAGLLTACVGLDANTLVSTPVMGEWTIKDVLAHVAFWDDLHTGRAELALAGREAEIIGVETHERNAELFVERRGWSLEQALQAAIVSRERCLHVFGSASSAQLVRPIHLPWRETCIWQWAWWRARHDAVHAEPIRAWRDAARPSLEPGPRSLLMAALEAAREHLLRHIDRIPPRERDTRPIVGDWTLQDLIGHIADWDRFALEGLRAIRESRSLPYVDNTDKVNAQQVAARREQTWDQAWADLSELRAELVGVLADWDNGQLASEMDYPFTWGRTAYGWVAMQAWHDCEHADTLRAISL